MKCGKHGTKICERSKVLGPLPSPQPAHPTAAAPQFNYNPCSSRGPDAWGALAIDCIGWNQSPINIVSCNACKINPHASRGLKLFRWDEVPEKVVILNVGATIKMFFHYKLNGIPMVCGGPLGNAYIFSDIHFHWATSSQEGSEHLIDGKSGAAEAHAVFYNRKYESAEKAMLHPDGLAVVARIFDAANVFKQFLPFVCKLKHLRKFNQSYTFHEPYTFTLSSVMGSVGFQYYVYRGSLTTPPCSEAVTWIVIKKRKKISICELEEFRKLRNAKNEWMTPNFRRIQPLHDRSIQFFTR